ncbi:hypothetical protein, partial [Aureimonas sp. AU20]|uniref:hypothetical protein n=1 Tax=Aureimonas sp. AU20 TaxID=1349819 RepID=UPI001FCDF03A
MVDLVDRAHDSGLAGARDANHDADAFVPGQALDGGPLLGRVGETLGFLGSKVRGLANLGRDSEAVVMMAGVDALLQKGFAFQNGGGGEALALDD